MSAAVYRALAPLVPGALYTFGTTHGGRGLGWYVGSHVEDPCAEAGTPAAEVLTFDTGYGLTTMNVSALTVLRVASDADVADLRPARTPMGFAHRVDYLLTWAAAERGVTSREAWEFFTGEALAAGEAIQDYLEGHLDGITACGAQVLYVSEGLGNDGTQLCLPCLMRTLPAGAARADLSRLAHQVSGPGWHARALSCDELRDLVNEPGRGAVVGPHGVRYLSCAWCGGAGQD